LTKQYVQDIAAIDLGAASLPIKRKTFVISIIKEISLIAGWRGKENLIFLNN